MTIPRFESKACGSGLSISSIKRLTGLCWCYFFFLLCVQIDSREKKNPAKISDEKVQLKYYIKVKTVQRQWCFEFALQRINKFEFWWLTFLHEWNSTTGLTLKIYSNWMVESLKSSFKNWMACKLKAESKY